MMSSWHVVNKQLTSIASINAHVTHCADELREAVRLKEKT